MDLPLERVHGRSEIRQPALMLMRVGGLRSTGYRTLSSKIRYYRLRTIASAASVFAGIWGWGIGDSC